MLAIGILASGNLGYETLIQLVKHYRIVFVLTDSNSKSIIDFCNKQQIDCFKGNPRKSAAISFLKRKSVEVIVSINYLFLIEEDIISHASGLIFNVHGSLLPKYRGRTPHVWAIINGETEVGITAHRIELGCDTGDIIDQIKIPVTSTNTGAEILSQYENLYFPLIHWVLVRYKENALGFRKQIESESTFFGKRTPKDGEIDWSWDEDRIRNWVRAQAYPYPGAFSYIGEKKVVIDKTIPIDFGSDGKIYEIGEVVGVRPTVIRCLNGYLEVVLREKIDVPLGSICKSKYYE